MTEKEVNFFANAHYVIKVKNGLTVVFLEKLITASKKAGIYVEPRAEGYAFMPVPEAKSMGAPHVRLAVWENDMISFWVRNPYRISNLDVVGQLSGSDYIKELRRIVLFIRDFINSNRDLLEYVHV